MKIKQLEWITDESGNSHADFMWQYYGENKKGYGDLLPGYLISFNLIQSMYVLYFGDDCLIMGESNTLFGCKEIAQNHFENIIRSCIND